MGDVGDTFRELNNTRKAMRARYGVECPQCKRLRPRSCATILLPGHRCRVDGYRDPRPPVYPQDYLKMLARRATCATCKGEGLVTKMEDHPEVLGQLAVEYLCTDCQGSGLER